MWKRTNKIYFCVYIYTSVCICDVRIFTLIFLFGKFPFPFHHFKKNLFRIFHFAWSKYEYLIKHLRFLIENQIQGFCRRNSVLWCLKKLLKSFEIITEIAFDCLPFRADLNKLPPEKEINIIVGKRYIN